MDRGNGNIGKSQGEQRDIRGDFVPNPNSVIDLGVPTEQTNSAKSAESNPRMLGASAIESVAYRPNMEQPSRQPDLGVVVDAELPPDMQGANANVTTIDTSAPGIDIDSIHTDQALNAAGVAAIEHSIQDLQRTGNAADFYSRARQIALQNIRQSYGRSIEQ